MVPEYSVFTMEKSQKEIVKKSKKNLCDGDEDEPCDRSHWKEKAIEDASPEHEFPASGAANNGYFTVKLLLHLLTIVAGGALDHEDSVAKLFHDDLRENIVWCDESLAFLYVQWM